MVVVDFVEKRGPRQNGFGFLRKKGEGLVFLIKLHLSIGTDIESIDLAVLLGDDFFGGEIDFCGGDEGGEAESAQERGGHEGLTWRAWVDGIAAADAIFGIGLASLVDHRSEGVELVDEQGVAVGSGELFDPGGEFFEVEIFGENGKAFGGDFYWLRGEPDDANIG